MKKKQIAVVFFLLLLITSKVHSQKNGSQKELFPVDWYTLDRNQVQYNQPKKFTFGIDTLQGENTIRIKCFTSEQYRGLYPVFHNHLISDDHNFMVYIDISPVYSKTGCKDSTYMDSGLMSELKIKISTYHLTHIKGDFWQNIGKKVESLENLPVTYKSSKYAHKSFNADTVATYPLKMWHKLYNKYNHCQVIMIQKNKRGVIFLYCFYNDASARKLNRYLKALKGIFWFRDPKDYIEVVDLTIEPSDDLLRLKKKIKN